MTKYLTPIAIVVAGLIIAGAVIYTKSPQAPTGLLEEIETAGEQQAKEKKESPPAEFTITEKDHIRGNPEATVTIMEYSDFQCSYCARFHSTVQQILEDYPDQVRWVYKHFPLDGIHSNARPAAEASECLAEQAGNEGFWQFADGLFEKQSKLGNELYNELASEIGVNIEQFKECVSARKYKDRVETDYQEGIAAGVRGTPGNFVNGEPIPGAVPYESLKAAVENALANL